jgi:hypothetical protein
MASFYILVSIFSRVVLGLVNMFVSALSLPSLLTRVFGKCPDSCMFDTSNGALGTPRFYVSKNLYKIHTRTGFLQRSVFSASRRARSPPHTTALLLLSRQMPGSVKDKVVSCIHFSPSKWESPPHLWHLAVI